MKDIAVVGLGKMGLLHSGIHGGLSLSPVKVCCEKEGLLTRVAKKMIPNMRIYEDYEEMLRKEDLEAVIITTPTSSHADIIQDTIKDGRGTSIFVEKPLATSYSEAKRLCDLAQSMKGIHMVGFQKRYSPTFRKMHDFLENGEIGTPFFLRSYTFVSYVFQAVDGWRFNKGSGGAVLDQGVHLLDLLIWLFGEPTSLTGVKKSIYSKQVEDYAHVNFDFQNGLLGYADISWSIRNYRLPETFVEVHGSNGVITASEDYVRIQLDNDTKDLEAGTHTLWKVQMMPSTNFLLADLEYTLEDQAFLDALASKKLPESNFFTAAKVNSVIDKIAAFTEVK